MNTATELLKEKKYLQLRDVLSEMQPADIALLLSEVDEEDLSLMFRILPKETAAECFVMMDNDLQELLIKAFSDRELQEILSELFLDDTVDIIEEMPAGVVKRILQNAEPDKRVQINELLNYSGDSAGSIMTTEYVRLTKTMTVSDAFLRIKRTAPDKETIYTCYVTDENRRLLGVITAKELMLADSDATIDELMDENVVYVHTYDDKEEAANLIQKYDFLALPVVDREIRLVGIVTVDDAIDVIKEAADEDIALMAKMSPTDDNYFKTSVFTHSKNRIIWLLVLMLSATFTGMIITKYEAALASALMVSFIPMLMDTGGNCGAQSSATVIRGLAVDEIKVSDFFRVLFKEIRIALLVGVTLALANAARILLMYQLFYKNSELYNQYNLFLVCLVVGITLIGAVVLAKTLGCCLPMLAQKLKLDPAMMASPLITTVVDACTVLLYVNIAIKVLGL